MTPEEQAAADAAANAELGWRVNLPEDMRADPSLVDFKDETEMVNMPVNVAKSFIHTKRMVGADTFKMPTTDEEFTEVYSKLGRPEAASQYVLNVPETDNVMLKENLGTDAEWFRESAHKHGLSDKQASGLFSEFSARVVDTVGGISQTAETEAFNVESQLRVEFGPAYDGKKVLMERALNELGGPEFVQELKKTGVIKTAAFQRAMFKVGGMMAEDLGLDKTTGDLIMSKDTAKEEVTALMTNAAYLDKTNPQHATIANKVKLLMEKIHGTAPVSTMSAGTM